MWSLWPLMMSALSDWAIDFFPNILVPLDNYISRGTEHFISCKDPDYQQSLWNMISHVMADVNLEDNDIEPAPKLIEVLFQNCKGQVDHWVEPYLRIVAERLHRTEKPRLKCLLMQVIADALYYNAALTLSILHKLNIAYQYIYIVVPNVARSQKAVVRESNSSGNKIRKFVVWGWHRYWPSPRICFQGEALGRVFKAALDLLVAYKAQVAGFSLNL
ncbi:unnamed protein product [Rhodiola kirilowii]